MQGDETPRRGRRRRRSLLPREHGVYAEVFFPLATALALGEPSSSGVLLSAAIVAAFLFHEPMLVLLGRRGERAKQNIGRRATTHALILGALTILTGTAGVWGAGPDARLTIGALLSPGLLLALLVAAGREKTLLGESLLAVVLSFASVPIAITSGVSLSAAIATATVWATAFLLGTTTVHAIIARSKRGAVAPAVAVATLALLLIVGVVTSPAVAGPWWPLAAMPTALVAFAAIALGVSTRRLRAVGVALVAADVATMAVLILSQDLLTTMS